MTSTFTDWTQMIGVIGLGMVGKAVRYGFSNVYVAYSDPKYNLVSINDLCRQCDEAIFVCVPTPTDDSNYSLLKSVLDEIKQYNYTGLVVVKSTVLPHHLEGYDVLYNPEFLRARTADQDFIDQQNGTFLPYSQKTKLGFFPIFYYKIDFRARTRS